mgnify:FL=1
MKRPIQTTIAAILNALFCLYSIVWSVPLLVQGASAIEPGVNAPPFAVVVLAIILGVAGLVASWGLWLNQKWAKVLTIVVQALGGMSALPGVIFASDPGLRMSAIAGVAFPVVIIVLLLWRAPQQATMGMD